VLFSAGELLRKYGDDVEIDVNVTDFTEDESRKALMTKDHIASLAEIDTDRLGELMSNVEVDTPGMLSIMEDMWAKYAGVEESEPAVTESDGDEIPAGSTPVSQAGDIWVCGDHRMACGDISSPTDFTALMNGEQAGLIVTDPPSQKKMSALIGLLGMFDLSDAVIVDPWARSGATMIAAEQLHKRCFSIDVSPEYVDSAVRKWQMLTGLAAILESTGQTFEETKVSRNTVVQSDDSDVTATGKSE